MSKNRSAVRSVYPEDIEYLGKHMHYLDVREINNSFPQFTPKEAVEISVNTSSIAFTATWDGEPAVMFGVCPTEDPGTGRAWLLNDYRKAEYGKSFLKLSMEYIDILQGDYQYLFNYVWVEHKASLLWLKRIGFEKTVELTDFNGYGETFNIMIRSNA